MAYWNLDLEKTHVLYNGVNLKQFAPDIPAAQQLRASLGIGDGPVVLYAGRVCHQKGTDVLLDAWSCLRAHFPEVRLVVCGPALQFGNSKQTDLTRRISALGGTYLGAVDETQLPAVMNLCDVFVMPTRQDEMFGMAALEAQACGKPVVCSHHGGLPEVIAERSGMFFPAGDHLALAACLRELLQDQTLHARLAAAARSNAERFSWDRLAERAESLYGTP
jgi:glycosyltransferase involved in cell wall biosynthesis